MNKTLKVSIACLLLAYQTLAQEPGKKQEEAKTRQIVFIAGPDSHGKGEHEHNGGCTLLAAALNAYGHGIHAAVLRNAWPQDTTVLDKADAIVIYADGGGDQLLMKHAAHIDKLVKKGVGLAVLHFALEVPEGTQGNHMLSWIGGYFEINWSVNPSWVAEFKTLPDHPVTRGVQPFSIQDEWYYHLRFPTSKSGITPVLAAVPPAETLNRPDGTHSNNAGVRKDVLEDKKPQTLAWAFDRPGRGRGFGFTGGHFHKNWGNDNYRRLVLNAIVWTAGMDVPPAGIPSATPTEDELNALTKQLR
ncbi:ThuA domain-containing protein [Dyadobacter sandarakinus]|uniref:ThuA domain-containing protein n=1 Tax=Dyadobacter sandarakinus TaxID=2747268 RepID=A0ABX7I723_9BACT|nr:ThuA domain-containing protein [Dyadobacter sandarakinus]QRR00978.1 ThuA domain-containing protein [Dyadobacter sandarakinus]